MMYHGRVRKTSPTKQIQEEKRHIILRALRVGLKQRIKKNMKCLEMIQGRPLPVINAVMGPLEMAKNKWVCLGLFQTYKLEVWAPTYYFLWGPPCIPYGARQLPVEEDHILSCRQGDF